MWTCRRRGQWVARKGAKVDAWVRELMWMRVTEGRPRKGGGGGGLIWSFSGRRLKKARSCLVIATGVVVKRALVAWESQVLLIRRVGM